MKSVTRRWPAFLRNSGQSQTPPVSTGWRGRRYVGDRALERNEKRRPLVVGEHLTPAEIPESITLGRDEAFDILEGLEGGAAGAWSTADLDRAVTYDRLAAVILRALGAEE